jgi:ribosomal protein S6E (S10)
MIINIAYPDHGTQKKFEYKDEKLYAKLFDLRLGEEVEGD